jgi:hypothetical protein
MSLGFLERIKANILGWSPSHPAKRVSHLMYIRGNNGYLQKVMEKPLPVKNESVAAKTRLRDRVMALLSLQAKRHSLNSLIKYLKDMSAISQEILTTLARPT